jgi:hypothetical protein
MRRILLALFKFCNLKIHLVLEFGWCPNGWVAFGMSCYEFATGSWSWDIARSRCQGLGGELVTISTPVEQALITRQVKDASWIGTYNQSSNYGGYSDTYCVY